MCGAIARRTVSFSAARCLSEQAASRRTAESSHTSRRIATSSQLCPSQGGQEQLSGLICVRKAILCTAIRRHSCSRPRASRQTSEVPLLLPLPRSILRSGGGRSRSSRSRHSRRMRTSAAMALASSTPCLKPSRCEIISSSWRTCLGASEAPPCAPFLSRNARSKSGSDRSGTSRPANARADARKASWVVSIAALGGSLAACASCARCLLSMRISLPSRALIACSSLLPSPLSAHSAPPETSSCDLFLDTPELDGASAGPERSEVRCNDCRSIGADIVRRQGARGDTARSTLPEGRMHAPEGAVDGLSASPLRAWRREAAAPFGSGRW
mmetsp:Transcript_35476/g.117576  ORF Transcript_35476/g.117576 Transcript_35476/m.117576 type:complete len:328 (-) Transcript_35476:182-1165(-)